MCCVHVCCVHVCCVHVCCVHVSLTLLPCCLWPSGQDYLDPKLVCERLLDWVLTEAHDKNFSVGTAENWRLCIKAKEVTPQQFDSDCGAYTMMFMYYSAVVDDVVL